MVKMAETGDILPWSDWDSTLFCMKNLNTMESWLDTPRGRLLLRHERAHLDQALEKLFGRTLLQIGNWAPRLLRTVSHWRSGVFGAEAGADVICDLGALPLAPNSVDAVLLAHSLESAESAHRLLREVDQVLSQRGQLLILGFNPFSWWGMRQRLLPWYPALPTRERLLSRARIHDWLRLLDYEVVQCDSFGPGTDGRLRLLRPLLDFFAPAYLIRARKRRLPLTPVHRPVWSRRPGEIETARLSSPSLSARSRSSVVVPFAPGADS